LNNRIQRQFYQLDDPYKFHFIKNYKKQ